MRSAIRRFTCTAAVGVLSTAAGVALAAGTLPPVESQHGVAYLSGGIGQGEAQAIEHAAGQWPLAMEFAQRRGRHDDYIADVAVVVRDAAHHTVLTAKSDGPFMLARLAPGHYIVDATFGDRTLHDQVRVNEHGTARAVFVWPNA